jgi:hypothetical protein
MTADALSDAGDAELGWLLSGSKSYKACKASDEKGPKDNLLTGIFASTEVDGNVTNK